MVVPVVPVVPFAGVEQSVPVDGIGPVTAGVAALVVGLLLVALVVVVRRVRRSDGVRLQRLLSNEDEVSVLMHPNPDPDAMACALAVSRLASAVDTDTVLQYPGEIRHQENRAFRTVLDLDLDRIETRDDLAGDEVVLVDHNEPRGFEGSDAVDPIAVVDHHPGGGEGTEFTDVRTDYGACATIFAEYFDEMDCPVVSPDDYEEESEAVPPGVATGMVYGIQADTNRLTKGCSPNEFEAAAYLYPGIDEDRLDRIANPQVSEAVLETKARAITDKEIRGSFAVCDLDAVPNVDAIPQAADELMHLEGVTAVIVFGDDDGRIHLSGRSRDDRVHMGETIRSVVDDIPMADGGGHARMGGAQLSVDHMQGIGPSEGLTREEFVDRLFAALAGEESWDEEVATTEG